MYYQIKFSNSNKMWNFVDEVVKSNYNCNNTTSTVELEDSKHPMRDTYEKSLKYGALELIQNT